MSLHLVPKRTYGLEFSSWTYELNMCAVYGLLMNLRYVQLYGLLMTLICVIALVLYGLLMISIALVLCGLLEKQVSKQTRRRRWVKCLLVSVLPCWDRRRGQTVYRANLPGWLGCRATLTSASKLACRANPPGAACLAGRFELYLLFPFLFIVWFRLYSLCPVI